MSTSVVFRDFTHSNPWRNKYTRARGLYDIWDANLHHGDVRPFACPELVCENVGNLKSLYSRSECPCLGFEDGRKIVDGFNPGFHFFVKDGFLREVSTSQLCARELGCRSGVPFNQNPPEIVSAPQCDNTTQCDFVMTSYVITYLTVSGQRLVESAPSPPSTPQPMNGNIPGATVRWGAPPQGFCITGTRLYRTTTANGEGEPDAVNDTEWVLVAEFEGTGTRQFTDNVSVADTGAPLLTYDPMAFPAPGNLVDLVRTETNIIVADKHRIYISIPGLPMFTWDGVIEIPDDILRIETIGNTVCVFTNNRPATVQFTNDDYLRVRRTIIERHLPLVSWRSVSVRNESIYFASEYSLYYWNLGMQGDNIQNVVQRFITPDQWKALDPSSVVGTTYEFGYIFSSDKMNFSVMLELPFMYGGMDVQKEQSFMGIRYITKPSVFSTDYNGHIIYVENNNLYRWDFRRDVCEEYKPYENLIPVPCETCNCCPWEIKLYYNNSGKNNFNHMRVLWDERSAPDLTASFHIHEFGREIERTDDMKVINSRAFGIPYNNVSYGSAYVKIIGCGIMHEVNFATSAHEIIYNSNSNAEGG